MNHPFAHDVYGRPLMPKPSPSLQGEQSGSFDLLAHAHFARTSDYLGRPALSPLSAQGVFPGGVMPRGSPIFCPVAAGLPRGPWQPNASTLSAASPSTPAGAGFTRDGFSEPGKRMSQTTTIPIEYNTHDPAAAPLPPFKSMNSPGERSTGYTPTIRSIVMDTDTHKSGDQGTQCASASVPLKSSAQNLNASRPDKASNKRAEGSARFESIEDKLKRQKSQSEQILQLKIDIIRLLLTTDTHCALLVIPPSLKVHKFATAGDFDTFLEMYASCIAAQQQKKKHKVKFRINDLWERLQGRGGLHQIESLCAALHGQGCNDEDVEELKDTYLAALAANEDPDTARASLARHLTQAIRDFRAETAFEEEEEA